MKKISTTFLLSCLLLASTYAFANNPLNKFITSNNKAVSCLQLGAACNSDFDCCSGWCAENSNAPPNYVCTSPGKNNEKVKYFEGVRQN